MTGPTGSSSTSSGAAGKPGSSNSRAASPAATMAPDNANAKADKGPKSKRRKVSRACVYCRRSHMTCDNNRPCLRCIKRDIGHWCRDEPRDMPKGKPGSISESNGNDADAANDQALEPGSKLDQQHQPELPPSDSSKNAITQGHQPKPSQMTPINAPLPISGHPANATPNWVPALQNQVNDIHSFHSSGLFNSAEVVNEYALLNDFLNPHSLEDGVLFGSDEADAVFGDSLFGTMGSTTPNLQAQQLQQSNQQAQSSLMLPPAAANDGSTITRPASTVPTDKSKDAYYLTAADPAGNAAAETRINELLNAKFKAGLLKPFNYITGYKRLGSYMEKHMQPQNRQKILRQLDKYRPKFRVRMEHLSDVELIKVEMWFERCLMEYDRVFASMAIPACCWRRTGEIYRGNKELAELIDVPVEQLRDGKLALYDIMGEADFAGYWELFGSIAFDKDKKGMLTKCSLKNPEQHSQEAAIACCFSFTIRRDDHDIPSIIVGNFLRVTER